MSDMKIIPANWDAPKNIIAFTTTRLGGISQMPYDGLNLGAHCGDQAEHVSINRQRLIDQQHLPTAPAWLQQVHGNTVIKIDTDHQTCPADASYTDRSKTICAILTADCLPILLCAKDGSQIAAIHAGWRSLASDIIAHTVKKLNVAPNELLAWLGPSISAAVYRVGSEVRNVFVKKDPAATAAFTANENQSWLANLPLLAQQHLSALNIKAIYNSDCCTYTQADLFYSYRRDGNNTGRMASLIYKL